MINPQQGAKEMSVVNTNVNASVAQAALTKNDRELSTELQTLRRSQEELINARKEADRQPDRRHAGQRKGFGDNVQEG